MKRQHINLSIIDLETNTEEFEDTRAVVIGPIAVHRAYNADGKWDICHVATGCRIAADFKDFRTAVKCACNMNERFGKVYAKIKSKPAAERALEPHRVYIKRLVSAYGGKS